MKKLMVFSALVMAFWVTAQTQEPKLVTFYLKNMQLLPKKVTLISYSPSVTGNGTNGYILFPGIKKSVSYTVGTKLYLATSQQVGVVMSGNRIDKDKPFLVVSISDANKTFKVN
jgi:hypothetical protein